MESYLKSWDGVVKEYRSFSRSRRFGMKNSPELENDGGKVGCSESCAGTRFSAGSQGKRGHEAFGWNGRPPSTSVSGDLKAIRCQHCDGKPDPTDSWWECECDNNEMTGCIVVPEDTPMNDLLRTALLKLGYPPCASSFATASILIRNWRPLPLEVICPDMKKKVGDILGEIASVVSLRIQIFRPKITASQKIKDNLLLFLINANHSFLRDSHCPLDLATLSKFCDQSAPLKVQLLQEPPDHLQRTFESWLETLQETERAAAGRKSQLRDLFLPDGDRICNGRYPGGEKRVASPAVEPSAREGDGAEGGASSEKESLAKEADRPQHFATPKTRVRTSFDPEFELPKLQKWFLKNPHPSRQQIYAYVGELNSLESRKGRKQLDVNNVVYWFKNARAAQKRTECRRFPNGLAVEANHCSVLKIPSGKSCGVTSDDQRSGSDDEASATSESGDDFRQDSGRCLQVVGKWNSNGQGEAVLEMQIPSLKNDFPDHGRKDKASEGEENSENIYDDDGDYTTESSAPEKSSAQTDRQSVLEPDGNAAGVRVSEATGTKKNRKGDEGCKADVPSKGQMAVFPSFKENGVNDDFLSPYKPGFPVPPNPVLNSSFMCMSSFVGSKPPALPLSSEERRKRNRTFIDPVTEVPRLEQWFRLSTHPSHNLIARYTEELNNMPYRKKFPKLEAKNVQFWFKNRRAKNKRLNYLETNQN